MAFVLALLLASTLMGGCAKKGGGEVAAPDEDAEDQTVLQSTQEQMVQTPESGHDSGDSAEIENTPASQPQLKTETDNEPKTEYEENHGTNINEKFDFGIVVCDDDYMIDYEINSSDREATKLSKFNCNKNPITDTKRKSNTSVMPDFNLDDTGFVRSGTKLADLNGNTFVFFTPDSLPSWSYADEKGLKIDEWS